MAYILPEEDDKKQDGADASAGMAPDLGGTGGGAVSPAAPPAQHGSGADFVSFDRVLGANQDAATKASNKLADNLQAGAQGVQQQANAAQQGFSQAVQAGGGGAEKGPVQTAVPSKMNNFGQSPTTPSPSPAAAPVGSPAATTSATKGQSPSATPAGPSPTRAEDQQPYVPTTGNLIQGGAAAQQVQAAEKTRATAAPAAYTGPDSIASSQAGWDGILGSAKDSDSSVSLTGQRDGNGNLRGDAGLETLLRNNAQGPYTSGESRLDASLLGATGRNRFDALQKDFGGLTGKLSDMDTASQGVADRMRGNVDAANAQTAAADAAREARLPLKTAYVDPNTGKPKDYAAYTKASAENDLFDISKDMNPIDWILDATGNKTMTQLVTPAVEGAVNKATGSEINSKRIDFSNGLPGVSDRAKQKVYESMTPDELAQVEDMSPGDQRTWLFNRLQQLVPQMDAEVQAARAKEQQDIVNREMAGDFATQRRNQQIQDTANQADR